MDRIDESKLINWQIKKSNSEKKYIYICFIVAEHFSVFNYVLLVHLAVTCYTMLNFLKVTLNSWIFSHSINGKICFPAITPLKGVNVEHIRGNNGTVLFGAKVLPRYVTKVPWSYPNFLWFPSVFKEKEKQRALFSVTEEELLV